MKQAQTSVNALICLLVSAQLAVCPSQFARSAPPKVYLIFANQQQSGGVFLFAQERTNGLCQTVSEREVREASGEGGGGGGVV